MQIGDAFGRLLLDHLEGRHAWEIIERDDGLFLTGGPPATYFAPFRRWLGMERRAMRLARGRVLDVGCGAGRVALHLQERGLDVVAIDVSPGAVEVSRRRGVRDARVLALADVDESSLGRFDTIVLYGNNFGLLESERAAVRHLRRLGRLTTGRGRILGESLDWSETDDPVHLASHERNRRRGRMPGQNRIRIRHGLLATPWFDYLLTTPAEMAALADASGWKLVRTLHEPDPAFALYIGILEKRS
jgi:SAM-dependent methyltransferase